jgi:hypothetical protein
MQKFKLDEIVSSTGKSIVYHRTVKNRTIKDMNYDLAPAGFKIDSNTTESQVKSILSGNLSISYGSVLKDFLNTVNGIDGTGIKINPGMYGPPGVYNTYELSSQFSGKMYHYGCVIVKSFLKMNHVLILDARYAQKIYGTLSKPVDQLKLFKSMLGNKEIKLANDAYNASLKDPNYLTSEFSDPLTNSKSFKGQVQADKIKGIVFTGASDGQVLVAYDQDILIPISWCFADDRKQITPWFKFSSTGGRNLRKIAAGKMKYEYDFNDSSFTRAKWFASVLAANDYKAILKGLKDKYIYPLMKADDDFLIFKFAPIRDLDIIKELFEVSNIPIINIQSKLTKSNILLEGVRKGNFTLANYLIDTYKVVDINSTDSTGTRLIDFLRTKASISDPEEIEFWNKLLKKPHYFDLVDLKTLLTGMGLIQESYSNSLKLYKSIY